jgi:hypothetical protein
MAYADKITTMRRMALITKGIGAIVWEGVNIEGTCVLKEVGYLSSHIRLESFRESELDNFIFENSKHQEYTLIPKYQDKNEDEHWEPLNDEVF